MTTITTTKTVLVDNSIPPSLSTDELVECDFLIVKERRRGESTAEDFDRWSTHIIDIVKASKDRLKAFSWTSRDHSTTIPLALWQALGSLKGLERLYFTIVSRDYHNWTALLEGSGLANLRTVRLHLDSAHGWDCAQLERFLTTLPKLEDLALSFPTCCGPLNISLSATFPNLKSLRLTTHITSPSLRTRLCQDLFRRHPQLESLYLDCDYDFTLTPEDLPNLRSLGLSDSALDIHPDFYSISRPIEKLYLEMDWNQYESIENLFLPVKGTLRVLELVYCSVDDLHQLEEFYGHLGLELQELIIVSMTSPGPNQFAEHDIATVMNCTRKTSIKTLHFRDWWKTGHATLSPNFLEDVGVPASPRLERIVWNPDGTGQVFAVHRDGGRVSLVQNGTLPAEIWE